MVLVYLELYNHHRNPMLEPYKEILKKKKKKKRNPVLFSYYPPVSQLPPDLGKPLIYFLLVDILVLNNLL